METNAELVKILVQESNQSKYLSFSLFLFLSFFLLPDFSSYQGSAGIEGQVALWGKNDLVTFSLKQALHEVESSVRFATVIVIVIVIAIFLGQFCPRGKGAVRLTLCEAPTHETRTDHNTGNYVPYTFR